MPPGYIVQVNQQTCILCGVCAGMLPEIFQQQHVIEINQQRAMAEPEKVALAIELCPMECISLKGTSV